MTTSQAPHYRGRIHVDRSEIEERLSELELTFELIARAAFEGDVDRKSVPPYGYAGQAEYDAHSRARSVLCEHGGETDGGWHAGYHHNIQVAFNHSETIAIHATAGTAGTGKPDGEPHNGSLKGPWSRRASRESAQLELDVEEPVDFWWLFTYHDDHGLWSELYAPIIEDGGRASGWTERIILGNLGPGMAPVRAPQEPHPIPEIEISRRTA